MAGLQQCHGHLTQELEELSHELSQLEHHPHEFVHHPHPQRPPLCPLCRLCLSLAFCAGRLSASVYVSLSVHAHLLAHIPISVSGKQHAPLPFTTSIFSPLLLAFLCVLLVSLVILCAVRMRYTHTHTHTHTHLCCQWRRSCVRSRTRSRSRSPSQSTPWRRQAPYNIWALAARRSTVLALHSARYRTLGHERPGMVLPDRALCLPTFCHSL